MVNRLLILLLVVANLWRQIQAGVVRGFPTCLTLTILAYLGLGAISALYSPYSHQSLQWFIVLFSYALLFYVLVSFSFVWDDIAKLLIVLIVMGIFEAGVAVFQGAWLKALRPSGTFFNPNFLAGYLVAVWMVVLGYLCYTSAMGSWRIWEKPRLPSYTHPIALILMMGLFLVAILWTGSRGAMLALSAGTILVVGVRFGYKGIGLFALLMVVAILIPNPFYERLQSEHKQNPLSYARWQIWQSSVQEMIDHPSGVGIGLSQYIYPRYAFPIEGQITRYGKVAQTAHNEYLQMGAELGVASLAIFFWGVILVARDMVWILRQRLRRWQRGLIVGLSGAFTTFLIHAAVDSNLHEPALAIVLTLCVSIILSVRHLTDHSRELGFMIPIRSKLISSILGIIVVVVLGTIVVRLGFAWSAYEAGSRAMENHDVSSAVERYKTAIALDPGKALYHSSLGAAYFEIFQRTHDRQSAQAATDELKNAIKLNPLDGRLSGQLGRVYFNFASSLPLAQSAGVPPYQQRIFWLGAAKAAYQHAHELEPYAPFYLLELGLTHRASGDHEVAEACVKRAIEVEPNFLPGRQWLTIIYLETGRIMEANHEYREILERQQRYRDWNKDVMESRFLTVDLTAITAALKKEKSKI